MNFIYLTILFPLIGFLILSFSQNSFSKKTSSSIGISSIGLSFLISIFSMFDFISHDKNVFNKKFWTWLKFDNQIIDIGFTIDGLSITMLLIVTGIGFLIHIFSSWYMNEEKYGYARFFSYTNLFIANMILLILADNLLLIYLGWEGVGICSYLLIGFYHEKIENCFSALKAFIITRIGDALLIFALFILWNELNTLDINYLKKISSLHFQENSTTLKFILVMILGGAIAKSAQIPLHTWLSDAMVGPTPVSALIHAATMVTAGVYLIARNYYLFLLEPHILNIIAIIGIFTLLIAGMAALVQTDIKRILAYSTISQLGYMFLALGIKSFHAAIFHLMTHAFFKASLFISASSLIKFCNYEQNIFKISRIKKKSFFIYLCFLISSLSLASFPIITSGFFSKKQIFLGLLNNNNLFLLALTLIGSFITSLYIFRMLFILFHKSENISYRIDNIIKFNHHFPLFVLFILSSFIGGIINLPLDNVFTNIKNNIHIHNNNFLILEIFTSMVIILGIISAFFIWIKPNNFINQIKSFKLTNYLTNFCFLSSYIFDYIYKIIFINPYLHVAKYLKKDKLNNLIEYPINLIILINKILLFPINGYISWYITSLIFYVCLLSTIILI